jgi:subtilisin family serine protease
MLVLGALALFTAALATPSAHAQLTPDEVVLSGFGEALPGAARTYLDTQSALGLLTYEERAPYYTLVRVNLSPPFPLTALNVDTLVSTLAGLAGVRFAERNPFIVTQQAPNDPLLDQQDYLGKIAAQQAWNVTNGDAVTLGIVDSGIDLGHPDLAPNLLGHGLNVRARNGSNAADDQGHGTEVMGAAAARGGNGQGIAGVAWASKVIAAKVTDAQGVGTATDIADGIRYVISGGARVVNVSMAGNDPSQALSDAVSQAQAQGVLLVVSAGNQGRDIDLAPAYPASLPQDNILAVAASQSPGVLAGFSNRGAGAVDITAPGVDVATTGRGGQYVYSSGTSLASPIVAGMAALLAAVHPDWGPGQLRARLMEAASGCRQVAGVAAGELCAPSELRVAGGGGGTGGGGSGAGSRPGSGGSGGSGAGSSTSSSSATLRAITRKPRIRKLRRGGRYRVVLRWRLRGDRSDVQRIAVAVDKRKPKFVGRKRRRMKVRVRRGLHKWIVVALDSQSRPLAVRTGKFRIRR